MIKNVFESIDKQLEGFTSLSPSPIKQNPSNHMIYLNKLKIHSPIYSTDPGIITPIETKKPAVVLAEKTLKDYISKAHEKPEKNKSNESFVYNKIKKSKSYSPKKNRSFTPQISLKSILIANKLGESRERLLKPLQEPKFELANYSFRPKLNKVSEKLAQKRARSNSKDKWESLYSSNKDKVENVEISDRNDLNEECTFRPNIGDPSVNINVTETIDRLIS